MVEFLDFKLSSCIKWNMISFGCFPGVSVLIADVSEYCISSIFKGWSMKAGIFDCPRMRQLINDPNFITSMNEIKPCAWFSLVPIVKNFLGNKKADNYIQLVEDMLFRFNRFGCNMSVKVHYLHSHLDRIPENLGDLSEEQGERIHQDIKTMEARYQGRWDAHMMAEYCWNPMRDCRGRSNSRKPYKRSFLCVEWLENFYHKLVYLV
jgi:hypothetical protein